MTQREFEQCYEMYFPGPDYNINQKKLVLQAYLTVCNKYGSE